jgi:hypothetical protein
MPSSTGVYAERNGCYQTSSYIREASFGLFRRLWLIDIHLRQVLIAEEFEPVRKVHEDTEEIR